MGMQFIVLPKETAKAFRCPVPWAAISISEKTESLPRLVEENRIGLLQLTFYDLSNPESQIQGMPEDAFFSHKQAEQILDFYFGMRDRAEVMLVHCEAGVSRSPGVAAALTVVQDGPRTDHVWFARYCPNILVYRRILETFYHDRYQQKGIVTSVLSKPPDVERDVDATLKVFEGRVENFFEGG